MSDLLPIVPGCLCIVIGACDPKYLGLQVTAIELDERPYDASHIWWTVELPERSYSESGYWQAPETTLMRIDGHQPDEQDITEKEKEREVSDGICAGKD